MFAKYSVELFMPVILYKLNYNLTHILLYLLITSLLNIIVSIPATKFGKKYGFKYLIIISAFIFIAMYFLVGILKKNVIYFLLVSLLSSLTNVFYYIGRHNYAGVVLENQKIGKKVGGILIATILANMLSSIFSSIMLERFNKIFIAIIATIIYLIGVLFIYKIKEEKVHEKHTLKEISKKIKFSNKIFFVLEQFKIIFFSLYPLYIYIFVDNSYSYIGLLYLITGLASIVFIYFFSLKIDENDNLNYLKISAILLSSILLLDMIISNKYLVLIIVFLEGIFIKLYETTVTNILYALRGQKEGSSYFLYMEILYNISRIIIIAFFLIFSFKIRTILYICLLFILLSGFIKIEYE